MVKSNDKYQARPYRNAPVFKQPVFHNVTKYKTGRPMIIKHKSDIHGFYGCAHDVCNPKTNNFNPIHKKA
jgi:hypothetical protein